MPIIDLSIDMDFFCREDPRWDWGHGEDGGIMENLIWSIRYGNLKLYQECDPVLHTDFVPDGLLGELTARRKMNLKKLRDQRVVGCSPTHEDAFGFFTQFDPPDFIINIDAHHDCWPGGEKELNCGNWMTKITEHSGWAKTPRLVQLYPKWKDPEIDGPPSCDVEIAHWASWKGWQDAAMRPWNVRHIFFCLSPAWVPPHFDRTYIDLVQWTYRFWGADLQELRMHPDRSKITPTREEAEQYYEEQQQARRETWKMIEAASQAITT